MTRLGIFLLAITAQLAPQLARAAAGDEVVVLYNSRVPASKTVAEHYAAMRHVPAKQIFSFALTTDEVMRRGDFTDDLQKPLVADLVKAKLWKFGEAKIAATANQPAHTEERVVESKIRYAVLCYGMPLKIAPDPTLKESSAKTLDINFQHNEASVDSELAWLPLVKMKVTLTGPLPNLFYTCTNRTLLSPQNGILLVARLDGPTLEIANSLVDKAMEAESNGLWGRAYFDAQGYKKNDAFYLGDQWMFDGATICREHGLDTETDTNGETFPASYPLSQIAIYAGWYAGGACGPFAQPKVEFMPGAFAYHLHSLSADTIRSATHNWCGPLLAKGATCTMGCVYEPYLQFTPNIAFFLQSFFNGYTFGEAAWASQLALSWQTTVIGDPLYQPFKKSPPELYAQLTREHNPLVEWPLNQLVNLDLVHGLRAPQLANFLENLPATAHSAVLTEKLANLYDQWGKPSSAIAAWQRALTLNPTPQQRIRIRRILAQKLVADGRDADAAKNWRQFIAEAPDYPGLPIVREELHQLEQKIAAQKTKP
ncbi:MAG TPA: TIGR03790 family protein [Verrucomicrobiae bacterium]